MDSTDYNELKRTKKSEGMKNQISSYQKIWIEIFSFLGQLSLQKYFNALEVSSEEKKLDRFQLRQLTQEVFSISLVAL